MRYVFTAVWDGTNFIPDGPLPSKPGTKIEITILGSAESPDHPGDPRALKGMLDRMIADSPEEEWRFSDRIQQSVERVNNREDTGEAPHHV